MIAIPGLNKFVDLFMSAANMQLHGHHGLILGWLYSFNRVLVTLFQQQLGVGNSLIRFKETETFNNFSLLKDFTSI